MKVISYIDKLVFQDFRQDFAEKKKMKTFKAVLFPTAFNYLEK